MSRDVKTCSDNGLDKFNGILVRWFEVNELESEQSVTYCSQTAHIRTWRLLGKNFGLGLIWRVE